MKSLSIINLLLLPQKYKNFTSKKTRSTFGIILTDAYETTLFMNAQHSFHQNKSESISQKRELLQSKNNNKK